MERPESAAPQPPEAPRSPYSTLWMPLVVVPAVIVGVLVLIMVLFGQIAGGPTSIEDSLRVVLDGGKNERTQAAFHLSQKIAENSRAALEGEELPWPLPDDMTARLESAWTTLDEDDASTRFLIASLMAETGDPQGVEHLLELLANPGDDKDNQLRFEVLLKLGAIGDARATAAVAEYANSKDAGLRSLVAIVLQRLGGEPTVPTLRGLLGDPELEVSANAAISLSKLGDPAGATVLLGMLDPEVYRAENEAHRERFRTGRSISESRRAALAALARLGRAEDRARIEAYRDDEDLDFRAAVLAALASWGASGSGS
ncbi:MAG: HEAT repeat domain-containing protein [Planctomycetes bacterium]|nr:HEAT repeat domain-containing protein [Planctomycetota bacterium]